MEADAPKWGLGLLPRAIIPADPTFIAYFPTRDSVELSNTTLSWAEKLAAPFPRTQVPAWSRVPIHPHASTGIVGLVMKRVGHINRRSVVLAKAAARAVKAAVKPELSEEEARRIRRRTLHYVPVQGNREFNGDPYSHAEMAAIIMQAKVDIVNNFMLYSSETSAEDKKQARDKHYVRVTPAKRYFDSDIPEDFEPTGGNTFTVYNEVLPIIIRATKKGMDTVDLTTASIAEASSIMQDIRKNPRRHLAANGVPDLSDIMDMTEPESPHMIRPPTLKAESRSPQKRISRLTSPIKNGFHRLTNSIVKLVPGSGPKAEPSPTKSTSTPSTPLKLSPTPTKAVITPSGNSSPLSRHSILPPDMSAEDSPPRPGRTFRAPSYADSSSFTNQTGSTLLFPEESPYKLSPSKFTRPVAPTPSRWNRAEPTTPQAFTPMPPQWTPSQTDSPIGLAALIPPSTPQMPKCTFTIETPSNAEFSFGDVSPSFNSISWMNPTVQASEPRRIHNVNSARRRQSEPLIRKHLKSQARRKSSSPRKVRFQDDDTFYDNTSTTSNLPAARNTSEVDIIETGVPHIDVPNTNAPITDTLNTDSPDNVTITDTPITHVPDSVATTSENIATAKTEPTVKDTDEPSTKPTIEPTVEPTKPTIANESKPEDKAESTEQTPKIAVTPADDHDLAPSVEQGVLNIDMRQNPDIFAAQPSSPIHQLAQMAEDGCEGHAKVVVTQENGRLFVRFKLPNEFAYLFPGSQGFDESRFTTSPSAISSSPRITFNARQPAYQDRPNSSPALTTVSSQAYTNTSPAIPRPSFQTRPGTSPALTQSSFHAQTGMSPSTPQFADTPTYAADDQTLVVDWALDTHASAQGTPSGQSTSSDDLFRSQDTPLRQSTSSVDLFRTPDVSGIGSIRGTPAGQTPAFRTPELPFNGTFYGSPPTFSGNPPTSTQHLSPIKGTPMRRLQKTPIKRAGTNTPTAAQPSLRPTVTPTPVRSTLMPNVPGGAPSAPTPTTAFTPVNKTPLCQVTTLSDSTSNTVEKTTPANTTPAANDSPAPASNRQETFDDSPGRDYMRDFIKRSRQSSTTETGSPMAPSAKRQPLVAKSHNTPSPLKKRKLEKDEEAQSPLEKAKEPKEPLEAKEPAAKRIRRTAKVNKKADQANTISDNTLIGLGIVAEVDKMEKMEKVDKVEEKEELDGPTTRRSSRLRTQTGGSGPKSSIPTAIKLNRSGAGRAGGAILNSTVKSDQQELTAQTRSNTKKNRGASEYPAQVLARVAGSPQNEDSDNSDAPSSNSSKDGKSVGWKEPLEMVQEESRPKGGKAGKTVAKAKPTQGKTGIAKPKATSQSKRTSMLAENLGMVANGTPRPQRMTRSRTRSQQ
ncbi:hypothetical protein AK830_g12381 [Neonectria ditissima]|uniref:Uncharacterized protein n=1 Tax=Neonectria ditissima TaxID=78410 RepID=A0A0P7AAW3_9HYPO|nr:hypothetical protein AK830_g12381 [Neonectria ditissima]